LIYEATILIHRDNGFWAEMSDFMDGKRGNWQVLGKGWGIGEVVMCMIY
jgi:hypothetical protein